MAGREKKPALVKKQISPVPAKEGELLTDSTTNKINAVKSEPANLETVAPSVLPAVKPVKKAKPKKTIKKNLKINFKPNNKKTKKIKLSKSIFKTNKLNLDSKNVSLIKNGIKNKKKAKSKIAATNEQSIEIELLPPVLEPMTDLIEDNCIVKKDTKKRNKKIVAEDANESLENGEKKQKVETETGDKETVEDILNEVAHELNLDMDALLKKPAKKGKITKKKPDTPKTEDTKPKKASPKKSKAENAKLKKIIKQESIIETLSKDITLDSAAQNVINNLDLNVNKTAKKKVAKKRRHSIEKIPGVEESQNVATFEQPFVLFTNTRRSASPKSKRTSRIRQSIESAVPKRFSPYTTRSDSPARILRNGKHRKLKDSQLLDGLECDYRKRRRLCSEYSGSEISKCSGYLSESDSSFSDLVSTQENGVTENIDVSPKEEANLTKSDLLKKEILDSIKIPNSDVNDIQNLNIKSISTKFTAILKRSLSTETSQLSDVLAEDVKPKLTEMNINSFTDTNSNDVKLSEIKKEVVSREADISQPADCKTEIKCDSSELVKVEKLDEQISEKIASSPSEKVPEKSIILDQMKQTFNDTIDDYEKRATRSSKRNLKLAEEKLEIPLEITPKVVENVVELQTEMVVETLQDVANSTEPIVENEKIETICETTAEEEPIVEEKEENKQSEILESVEKNSDKEIIETETTEAATIETENIEAEEIETEATKTVAQETEATETEATEIETTETEIIETETVETENIETETTNLEVENETVKENTSTVEPETETITEPDLNSDIKSPKQGEIETDNDTNNEKIESTPIIEETPENLVIKENILSALGLQSWKAAEEAKLRDKQKPQIKTEEYTGTLKTVIKLNRQDRKKRIPLKMTLQKSKIKSLKDGEENVKTDGSGAKSDGESSCYKVMKESGSSTGWRHGSHSSDTAGANRKSHYSNRSNMDGSSEHASDGDVPATDGENSGSTTLVIPEKASSFSIHPDRLCSDECAYCFGKFGLFDTPLHIAQIKSVERQNKILENEIYLMRDSCLCDACYRHVDRRLNSSSYSNKNYKRTTVLSNIPRPNHCHVLGCEIESSHVLRRKWLIKMRKSVSRVINIDLDNPGLHSIPICAEHYGAVEHLMVCALCRRRLARNHVNYLGSEWKILNEALEKEGIPIKLTDKPVVCKLCRYFATLLLKPASEIKSSTLSFFKQYKRRLLHFHDVEVMDEAEAEEPISVPLKEKSDKDLLKKSRKNKPSKSSGSSKSASDEQSVNSESHNADADKTDQSRVPSNSENGESRESTPSDSMVDIETLVPNMVLECPSDTEECKSEVPHKSIYKKLQIPDSVREAVEISKIMKITAKSNSVVDRLGSNPSISVRQLFPGEEDLPLQGHIDFNSVKEQTPEGWEKCSCTIQYDVDTKHLWQELQKPYGNQSSFLRHLILLEKYFRNGDLTLSPNASHHAVNYSVSVQNRLRAYDNIPQNSLPMQPLTMLPFNQIKKSQSGIITTKEPVTTIASVMNAANLPKNTPIPISQLHPNFLTPITVRQKSPGVPPGLISLQPGTNRPVNPLIKMPQKFKFPLGKNWRPTLIPVTSQSRAPGAAVATGEKRLTGLVQVVSGGKPYHISIQDYNRMCYIKKNHELKQKIAEMKQKRDEAPANSVLKPVIPRKPKPGASAAVGRSPAGTSVAVKDGASAAETLKLVADKAKDVQTQLDSSKGTSAKSIMILPKIPKSLTVIPQTVARKPPQPSSPTLSITTKPSTSKS